MADEGPLQQLVPEIRERVCLVEGAQVDFWSGRLQSWIPATITSVTESGVIRTDAEPGVDIRIDQLRFRLRPRARPTVAQLDWVRRVLHEGRVEMEAAVIFNRYANREIEGCTVEAPGLHLNAASDIGKELDELMGLSGSSLKVRNCFEQSDCKILCSEAWTTLFWEQLWSVHQECGQALCRHTCIVQEPIDTVYQFTRLLGKGTFGQVFLAESKKLRFERAIKMIEKTDFNPVMVEREVRHLCALDHPHIVKLYEHYENEQTVFLVMDFCSGGSLKQVISQKQSSGTYLKAAFIAECTNQILQAIAHVHARGIVHLDLKTANIMLLPRRRTLPPARTDVVEREIDFEEEPHVLIIDLGVAQIFRPGNFKRHTYVGTPSTMAPEVWHGEITPKADIFSIGIVLFESLSFELPFDVPVDERHRIDPHAAIAYWKSKPGVIWEGMERRPFSMETAMAIALTRQMLVLDRYRRPSAKQCLNDAFVKGALPALQPLPPGYFRELLRSTERSVLHKSVALIIAQSWPANQLPTIKRLFEALDVARVGRLSKSQICVALERMGVSSERAPRVADAMDLSRQGSVCWTEFVAACIDLGSSSLEEDLLRLFEGADGDGDGLLSQADLAKLLAAEHLRGEAVTDVFRSLIGREEDGARVDWPTFRKHFRPNSADGADTAGFIEAAKAVVGDTPESAEPHQGSGAAAVQVGSAAGEGSAGRVSEMRNLLQQACRAVGAGRDASAMQHDCVESHLKRLEEMGFRDRRINLEALSKHNNRLGDSLVEELMSSTAFHIPDAASA